MAGVAQQVRQYADHADLTQLRTRCRAVLRWLGAYSLSVVAQCRALLLSAANRRIGGDAPARTFDSFQPDLICSACFVT